MRTRIINSYENVKYEDKNQNKKDYDKSKENEEEIKDCEIFINDKKINFTYYYKFLSAGNYIIKYKFKKLLKITNFMFADCNSLISLDLSNFNTQNITDMSSMFSNCKSLKSLDLSNFNTQNVIDMSCMFSSCNSLTSLNLSNFDTQNVTDMSSMFYNCNSLIFKIIKIINNNII